MHSNDQALKLLHAAEAAQHNMIMLCEPQNLPELHRLIIETIHLKADTEGKNAVKVGDIYYHALSKKWALHHQAKLKLSLAASIEWDTVETKPVVLQRDYIHFQAVGQIRREYGRIIRFRGDYEFDLESLKEDLFNTYIGKAKTDMEKGYLKEAEREAWIRNQVQRDFAQKRQFRLKLAATGAKSVVIDKLLNLKSGYASQQEILQPFTIVRCQIAPDLSDKDTREKLTMIALQSIAGVYGPRPALPPPDASETIDLPPEDYRTNQPETTNESAEHEEAPPAPSFNDLDRVAQLEELSKAMRMADYTYDAEKSGVPFVELNEKNRLRLYQYVQVLIANSQKEIKP